MIVCLANKVRFRDDILSNRIEEIVAEFEARTTAMNHLEQILSFSA
jgi:hypothetical protein